MEKKFSVGSGVRITPTHYAEGSSGTILSEDIVYFPWLRSNYVLPGTFYKVLVEDVNEVIIVKGKNLENLAKN